MDEIGKDDVYKAERILDTKIVKGKKFFLIKWDGWDESNNTWEPEKNIIDTRLIDMFYELRKNLNNISKANSPTPVKTSKDQNESTRKEEDLRSVIRIAEGLRPLSKSSYQAVSSKTKSADIYKKTINSDSTSSSEPGSSIQRKTRTSRVNNSGSSANRFMRRRKLSSSSVDSSLSSSSSVVSIKRNGNKKDKTLDCSEDSNPKQKPMKSSPFSTKIDFKKNHVPLKHAYRKAKSQQEDSSSATNESANSSFDDYSLSNCIGDDIFVTDITSGVVTVTIKESISPDGFFKSRERQFE